MGLVKAYACLCSPYLYISIVDFFSNYLDDDFDRMNTMHGYYVANNFIFYIYFFFAQRNKQSVPELQNKITKYILVSISSNFRHKMCYTNYTHELFNKIALIFIIDLTYLHASLQKKSCMMIVIISYSDTFTQNRFIGLFRSRS